MITKLTLEQKFTMILATKMKREYTDSDIAAFTDEELSEFKEWVAKINEDAEEKIWKKKRAQRAAKSYPEKIDINAAE